MQIGQPVLNAVDRALAGIRSAWWLQMIKEVAELFGKAQVRSRDAPQRVRENVCVTKSGLKCHPAGAKVQAAWEAARPAGRKVRGSATMQAAQAMRDNEV